MQQILHYILLIIQLSLVTNEFNSEISQPYTDTDDDCFRAAVFEHISYAEFGNYSHNTSDLMRLVNMNLDAFENATRIATKTRTKIIVFPEDGINSGFIPRLTQPNELMEQIPDPQNGSVHNPCDEREKYSHLWPILYRLSCMAKKYQIYVMANMGDFVWCNQTTDNNCPHDQHYQFNTDVVFDDNGYLIAKYHKIHLFYETYYNVPPSAQLVYFDTPFGRLGLHTCFDILYSTPGTKLVRDYGVNTMLYSTWWFDDLPLYFATQMQQSWAITNNVNLLAANMHDPITGSFGSGIYSGRNGAIISTQVPDGRSKLLIADIPIKSANIAAKCFNEHNSELIVIDEPIKPPIIYNHMNLNTENITFIRLTKQTDSVNVCSDGLCCGVNYSVHSVYTLSEESYFIAVANRSAAPALSQQRYPICEEICAVMRCDGDLDRSCLTFPLDVISTVFNSIHISANFSTEYSYPSVTANNLQLVPISYWNYTNEANSEHRNARLDFNGFNAPILTAGFYGRCFDRDQPYVQ